MTNASGGDQPERSLLTCAKNITRRLWRRLPLGFTAGVMCERAVWLYSQPFEDRLEPTTVPAFFPVLFGVYGKERDAFISASKIVLPAAV